MNRIFGLIGFPLSHSFSADYFKKKFREENISDSSYQNFELPSIDQFPELILSVPGIQGLNVTIPYKEKIIKFLTRLDKSAKRVNAVNVIKKLPGGELIGYNSDYYGFRKSLELWIGSEITTIKALVLGSGGAAKAVFAVLEDCNITFKIVSRTEKTGRLTYFDLRTSPELIHEYRMIINTSPVGMYPKINEMPNLPYESINGSNYLYDLIYNPEKTLFLKNGEQMGAKIKNGKEMLILQAERSWDIWNNPE